MLHPASWYLRRGAAGLASALALAPLAAGTATAGPALTTVTPMAADADSAEFSAALNATGAAYLAAAAEHVGQRTAFAGAQALGAGTYVATEAVRAANLA